MKYDFVIVSWHDAHAIRDQWMDTADIDDEPLEVRSAGFLIPEAKTNHIVLTQSENDADGIDGVLAIPCAMVQSMRVVCSAGEVPFSLADGKSV
jgi:hypothetical protein